MAKGQEYTKGQTKIINRYYEHLDTITAQKLGELVSELAVCDDAKKADRLWGRVRLALEKTSLNKTQIEKVLATKDVAGLARLVSKNG